MKSKIIQHIKGNFKGYTLTLSLYIFITAIIKDWIIVGILFFAYLFFSIIDLIFPPQITFYPNNQRNYPPKKIYYPPKKKKEDDTEKKKDTKINIKDNLKKRKL